MYYKVSEIYIDGRFFQGCLYFYSQQFTSAVVKTALILYNLPYNLPYIPDRELLLTWNLVDITSNLKAFKKQKICWIRRDIFCLRHHMSAFSNLNFDLLLLDWVLYFYFFAVFQLFTSFKVFSIRTLLLHFGLEGVMFFFRKSPTNLQ